MVWFQKNLAQKLSILAKSVKTDLEPKMAGKRSIFSASTENCSGKPADLFSMDKYLGPKAKIEGVAKFDFHFDDRLIKKLANSAPKRFRQVGSCSLAGGKRRRRPLRRGSEDRRSLSRGAVARPLHRHPSIANSPANT